MKSTKALGYKSQPCYTGPSHAPSYGAAARAHSEAFCVQAVKMKGNLPQTKTVWSCPCTAASPPPPLLYCSTAGMQTSKVRSVSITCSSIIPTLCNSLLKKETPSGVSLWWTECRCTVGKHGTGKTADITPVPDERCSSSCPPFNTGSGCK